MRVGTNIRGILAITDQQGATITELYKAMDLPRKHLDQYCKRAVARGLLSVSRSSPRTYTAVEGWQEAVKTRNDGIAERRVATALRPAPSSFCALHQAWGAMA